MKRWFWLLLCLFLGACTTGESTSTPVAQAITTTPTLLATVTATAEPVIAEITATMAVTPTHTPEPTLTPTPIPPPTGRIYFLWDPTKPIDGYPNPVQNLYMAIPGQTPDDWEVETVITGLAGLPVVALSPDKTKLALTAYEDVNNDGYIVSNGAVEDAPNIFVYSFSENTLDRLTDNFPLTWDLTWSSDNERLAYQNGKDVYIATYPGLGERELLYAFPDYVQELAWSPDSHYLAIGIYGIGIYLFDDATGELINLDMAQQGSNLAWSPDGQWLVSSGFVGAGLNVIKAANLDILILIEEGSSISTWSPDGHYLAFTQSFRSDLGVPLTSSLSLWDVRKNEIRLISEAISISGAIWSSDGRSVVIGLLHEDRSEMIWFDAENGGQSILLSVPDGKEMKPLALSPDGQWVFFYSKNSNESSLNLIHQTGGRVYQLVDTTDTYMPYGVFWLSD